MPDHGHDQPYRVRSETADPRPPARTGPARSRPARAGTRTSALAGVRSRPAASAALSRPTSPPPVVVAGRAAGVRLAVTGRVPAGVRARVLAEYRAELAERRNATVADRVRKGVHVQRVPYGYRVEARPGWTGPTGRAVMAPPWTWSVDPDAAQAIDAMALWYLAGRSDAWIAGRLTYARGYPRPLTVHGTERDFTAALVARILTDPTWTGRQAWGRTRAGRPLPRTAWEPLGGFSHPAVIDLATSARLLRCRADRRRPGVPG